uniref:SFRICE_009690 n=1 Tax=Spodoptera frugiperda TaxID=7108 RepID=A0A2H1VPP0_SPOFR
MVLAGKRADGSPDGGRQADASPDGKRSSPPMDNRNTRGVTVRWPVLEKIPNTSRLVRIK